MPLLQYVSLMFMSRECTLRYVRTKYAILKCTELYKNISILYLLQILYWEEKNKLLFKYIKYFEKCMYVIITLLFRILLWLKTNWFLFISILLYDSWVWSLYFYFTLYFVINCLFRYGMFLRFLCTVHSYVMDLYPNET